MTNNLKPILAQLAIGETLTEAQAEAAFGIIMSGEATPAQIARQAADMARAVLAGHALAAAQYARDMEIATNPHVARSLDIALESEAALRDRLRQLEDRP